MASTLTLNVEKTVAMNFSTKLYDAHSVLKINIENLSFVESTKYLGVFVNRKLTFTKHVRTVCKKLSKT